MSLEAPAAGAAAINPMGGDAAPSPAQPEQPAAPTRRRSSDFQPNLGYEQPEDPSRVEKKLGGEQLTPPEDGDQAEEEYQDPQRDDERGDVEQPPQEVQELAAALHEAMTSGKPLDAAKLKDVPFEINGHVVTIESLVHGNMRQSDYTRKLKTAEALRDRAQHVLNLERARNQDWQNHGALYRDLCKMGLQESVDRMVYARASEEVNFRKLDPAEQQRILFDRERAAMREQMEAERQAWREEQERAQRPTQEQVTRHFEMQLNRILPAFWKQYNLPTVTPQSTPAQQQYYKRVHGLFIEALEARYDGSNTVTPEMVSGACESVRQEIDERMQEIRQLRKNAEVERRRGQPLPAARAPGAPGAVYHGNGKRSKPSEFGNRFNSYGL